jgi:hypothetical protein
MNVKREEARPKTDDSIGQRRLRPIGLIASGTLALQSGAGRKLERDSGTWDRIGTKSGQKTAKFTENCRRFPQWDSCTYG